MSAQSGKSAKKHALSSVWRKDFSKAWEEAQRLSRPILVHFYADWCGPCQQMERTVLNSPEVLKQLDTNFVAVKVNSDKQQDLVKYFNVRALPCDIFIHPDGSVISQTEGFQDKSRYSSKVIQIGSRFEQSAKIRIAKDNNSSGQPLSNPDRDEQSDSEEPIRDAEVATGTNAKGPPTSGNERKAEPLVGLDGYCPVSLGKNRKWVKGKKELAETHQNIVYYIANADELRAFRANPGRYAPQLLGCDPVVLWNSDRAVLGDTQYGAYFDDHLYLFDTAETRKRFKQNPLKYTRTEHVLRVDRLDRTQRR